MKVRHDKCLYYGNCTTRTNRISIYFRFAIYNSVAPTRPNSLEDIDLILNHLDDIQRSVYDYIAVLRMGIQKGMVRTRGECVAGLNAFKAHHLNISRNGPDGESMDEYFDIILFITMVLEIDSKLL